MNELDNEEIHNEDERDQEEYRREEEELLLGRQNRKTKPCQTNPVITAK